VLTRVDLENHPFYFSPYSRGEYGSSPAAVPQQASPLLGKSA
jgi:hypothetical protein